MHEYFCSSAFGDEKKEACYEALEILEHIKLRSKILKNLFSDCRGLKGFISHILSIIKNKDQQKLQCV